MQLYLLANVSIPYLATQIITEYIIKGFAMDDERLKNDRYFGKDYFQELALSPK